ncbi:hypothetical protein KDA_15220 [Dictyobacter alpinus]|uniref:histidine kinase n=1 Tax=Dictyobacter alpinus TaxID=2014873 RepID=A0A402B3X0_9CHLR|nr:HAMP domain-containing sensor histidine kinase [Dictyobacter alpinus]GCE26038.1 hypothetical protein KDA_15220 [Dictyobacter alpinus]
MFEKQHLLWQFSFTSISFAPRLAICIICTLLSMITYLLTFSVIHVEGLLLLSMLLWAWGFSYRGTCICFLSCFALSGGYVIYQKSINGPASTILISTLFNLIILLGAGQLMAFFKETCGSKQTHLAFNREQEQQRQMIREQLRQFEQLKTQFVINVNHELRTSLAATYSYFELLNMLFESHGYLQYQAHGIYLQDALRHCDDLRAIVNNILVSMDIDNTQAERDAEECSIAQIVLETCDHIAVLQHEQYRMRLQISTHLWARANRQYLRHILHQLLTNALKYTPSGTSIILKAEADHYDPQMICISVQDAGPGIPLEEHAHVFEQFARLPRDVGGTVRGTGLGLYICQQLVERLHGRIWVESSGIAGEGSCFRFTLPRVIPTHATSITTQVDSAHTVGRR